MARARRAKFRRYLVANDLRIFATFTFGPKVYDYFEAERLYKNFIQRLSYRYFENRAFPHLSVPSVHEDGGWHIHAVLPMLDPAAIEAAWGHGRVEIRWLNGRDDQRSVAFYLCDNITDHLPRRQKYLHARRFDRQPIEAWARSAEEAEDVMNELMEGQARQRTYRYGIDAAPLAEVTFYRR